MVRSDLALKAAQNRQGCFALVTGLAMIALALWSIHYLFPSHPDPACTGVNRDKVWATGSVQELDALDDRCYGRWND